MNLPKLPIQKLHWAAVPHTLLSVHASNRIGTSACSKRTEVCNMSFQTQTRHRQFKSYVRQASINFRLQYITVCGTFPRLRTNINQQCEASECWHQAASSCDSHSFFILWPYLRSLFPNMLTARSVTEIGLFARCAKPFRITVSSAWHVFPYWINNAGSQNSR